jgi:tRNA threonylcarbamoyladenosine biosynthesis protein TsaE
VFTVNSNSELDTTRFGAALASVLEPGMVVALVGTLGAGKTRLVQAVTEALGVPRDRVTSPTFILVNEYVGGRLPVFHFDVYRLKDLDEFLALGPDEYFESRGVTFVEWADRVAELLPSERLTIELDVIGPDSRQIAVIGTTKRMSDVVTQLEAAWNAISDV